MATQIAKEQSRYAEAFRALRERGVEPGWLNRLRADAFERFEHLGFPTTDLEDWKYTNIAPIARTECAPVKEREEISSDFAAAFEQFTYRESARSQLVFLNGVYQPRLSSTDALAAAGAVALDLAEALKSDAHSTVLREHLSRVADYKEHALVALNTALFSGGALLYVPRGVKVEAPVHLLFLSDSQADNMPSLSSPRVLVVAERGADVIVIESYAASGEGAYWTNAVTEIVLADEARAVYYRVQREAADAFHTATTKAALGRASSFNSTNVTLGARLSRHDVTVSFGAEGGECWVDGLYVTGTGQHADTHSLIEHAQPNCTSHQLYKGILDGKSRAVFNGKVFVHEGARGTDAMQTNRNLLLSPDARVDTKPQLEIFNDDVKCAHGATVGQLEEEELFYLVSRGLHPDLARNLLTYGFAEEVIEKIKIESIKAQLDGAVLNRLHARLEA